MLKAVFFCDVYREDEVIDSLGFDEGIFENQKELDQYIRTCNYEIGQPCGYWGDDVGILTEILTDEM